jgi:hypothetical protein
MFFKMKLLRTAVKTRFANKTAPPIQGPPKCKDCKWSVSDGKYCLLFNLNESIISFNAENVRKNTDLCGPDGIYFKPIKKEIN